MQSRIHSLIESAANTGFSFFLSVVINLWLLPTVGLPASFKQNVIIVCVFTVVSVVRNYFVRRFFNWLHERRRIRDYKMYWGIQ